MPIRIKPEAIHSDGTVTLSDNMAANIFSKKEKDYCWQSLHTAFTEVELPPDVTPEEGADAMIERYIEELDSNEVIMAIEDETRHRICKEYLARQEAHSQ